jgi:hypothetical protein
MYTDFGELPHFDTRHSPSIAIHGGIPQLVNFTSHLAKLTAQISDPNASFAGSITCVYYLLADYSGVISIDYEAWNPYWEGCCGAHVATYLNASIALQRKLTPDLNASETQRRAIESFQSAAALDFWVLTVRAVRALRPNASVGIYNWPNFRGDWSAKQLQLRGAFMVPFYREVNSMQPSVYIGRTNTTVGTVERVTSCVRDSAMLAQRLALDTGTPAAAVHAFAWYRYNRRPPLWPTAEPFLSDTAFEIEMVEPFNAGADAVLIWGYEPSDQNKSDAIAFLESHKDTFIELKTEDDDTAGIIGQEAQRDNEKPRPTFPMVVPNDYPDLDRTTIPVGDKGLGGVFTWVATSDAMDRSCSVGRRAIRVALHFKTDDSQRSTRDASYSEASVLGALAGLRAEVQAMKTTANDRAGVPRQDQAVLDVTAFGADRTGAKPSDAAINAAITIVNARGGMSTVLFPPGVYRVESPLLPIAGHNIVVEGHGALVDWRDTTDHACLLRFQAVAENATALVSDIVSGQDTVEFATEIQDGQLVRLNSSEQYYNTTGDSSRHNKKGELLVGVFQTQCANETYTNCGQTRKPSRTLHPDGKSPIFGYKKALTSATIITPSTNIAVRGLSVRGPGAHLLTVALAVGGSVICTPPSRIFTS